MSPNIYRVLWLLVLIFSAFVLQWNLRNLGGNFTPRSVFAWATLVLATGWCWLAAWHTRQICWRKHFIALFVPPLAITLWASLGPEGPFENYALKSGCALLFGALWVTALMQIAMTRKQWLHLANTLFVAAIVLALNTMTGPNYFDLSPPLPNLLTISNGGFQQPNNFASFLATALVFNLWAYTRHLATAPSQDFYTRPAFQLLVWVGVFVISLMVWLLGSRTGYLGLLLASALLYAWVITQHRVQKNRAMAVMVAIVLALLITLNADQLGLKENMWLLTRLKDIPTGNSTVTRQDMWWVSVAAWWQAPLLGHGLGSFTEVFTPVFDRLVANGLVLQYTENLSHPHNELLLWLCETGLVGTALILGPWLAWVFHRKPGTTWAGQLGAWAVLIPIALHCMTEYPLHGSGAHWLLLGLVLAAMHEPVEPQPLNIPRTAWLAGFSAITVCGSLAVVFLIHTGYLNHLSMLHIQTTIREPAKFLNKLANSAEMHHPFLGQASRDYFLITTVDSVFASGNKNAIDVTCIQLKDLQRRSQNEAIKEQLKACPN